MVETVHEATTPQRTGGQRQRSSALSTKAGENCASQQANGCCQWALASCLPGEHGEATDEGKGPQVPDAGAGVRPERLRLAKHSLEDAAYLLAGDPLARAVSRASSAALPAHEGGARRPAVRGGAMAR